MQENIRNTGLLIRPPQPTDSIAGAESIITYEEINANWGEYLPTEEKQKFDLFDTLGCTTFSLLNSVESQVNYLIRNKLTKEQIKKLEDLGYLDGNYKFNCSDRFTAKMSGTTKKGNYQTNVAYSIRHDGILPERDWLPSDKFEWDEYYAEIPQALKDKAKEILEIFEFRYEWVITPEYKEHVNEILDYHLKQAPVQIAAPVCPKWNNKGVVPTCPLIESSHATMVYGQNSSIEDFDHYVPFKKKLALDYPIPWGLKMVVLIKKAPEDEPTFKYKFNVNLKYGDHASPEIRKLQEALQSLRYMKKGLFGPYGPQTALAVSKLQTDNGIFGNNGMDFGPKTRAVMNKLYN